MKTYKVTLYYHTTLSLEVEADNEQDALEQARCEVDKEKYCEALLFDLQEDNLPDIELIK